MRKYEKEERMKFLKITYCFSLAFHLLALIYMHWLLRLHQFVFVMMLFLRNCHSNHITNFVAYFVESFVKIKLVIFRRFLALKITALSHTCSLMSYKIHLPLSRMSEQNIVIENLVLLKRINQSCARNESSVIKSL